MAAKAKNTGSQPGKRVVVTTEEREIPPESPDELDLEAGPENGEDQDFASVLADLAGGSEARCEVRRTSPAEFAGYCCTYAVSEMSLDRLAEEWGGGKFNVRVRDSKGVFRGSTSIQIAGKSKNRGDGVPAPVLAQPAQNDALAGVLAAIQASQKASQDAAAGQISLLTTLVTSLINREPPKPEKGPDVLQIIGELKGILAPAKSDSGDAVKLLLQGIELGKDLGGGGGEGDGLLGLAGKGMDMVKSLAAQQGQRRMVPRRQQPPPRIAPPPGEPEAGTVEAQPAVEVVKEESPPMLKLLGWIKQQAALLVYQAKRGRDPQLYADLFLDNIPEGIEPNDIYQRMSSDAAIKDLAEITGNQEVLQHLEWMERFRQAVLTRFHEAAAASQQQSQGDGGAES